MKVKAKEITQFFKKNYSDKQLFGLELEHFILDDDKHSVLYSYKNQKVGIKEILKELSVFYNEEIYENYFGKQYIIGLKRDDAEISIEPGAQFEVSFSPKKSINKIYRAYQKFLKEINPILNKYNYSLATIGYRPDLCALEVPLIPKMRYLYMDANFKAVDTHGYCMMRNTAATQINIDYKNEKDCIKKMKVATILSPLFYFLFDNSPNFEGCKIEKTKISKSQFNIPKRMARWEIWNHTDNDRCTSTKNIFNDNFCLKDYSKTIINLPNIFTPKNINKKSKLIKHKLSMCFFDVRLSNTIELRAADSMPIEYVLSYMYLIKELFYKEKNLNYLFNKFKDVTFDDYCSSGKKLQAYGWKAKIYGQKVYDLLDEIILLCKNPKNIDLLIKLVNKKKCLKDVLNNKFLEKKSNFKPISSTANNTNIQAKVFPKCKKDLCDFFNLHKNSKAIFMDEIVNAGYFSKVYEFGNAIEFDMIVKKTCSILHKVTQEYRTNKSYQNLFKWDDFREKLINFNPKYKQDIPIARFDIFFNDKTGAFEFCEFNTGGSASMSEVTYINEEIETTYPYNYLKKYLNSRGKILKTWELYDSWVKEFLKIYKEWAKNTNHKCNELNIAIVDFLDNCQISDFWIFRDHFISAGYNCEICDLRDLHYDGESLISKNGTKIDAIYKRVTLNDLQAYKDDKGVNAMINAVLDDKVCPIDWFSDQIIHDKQIFYILFMPESQRLFSPSELSFLKKSLPETHKLTKQIIKNKKFVKNKNKYVIKPIDSRNSKNVYAGKDLSNLEWKKALKSCLLNGNYIIQKFCNITTSQNVFVNVYDKNASLNEGIKQFCNMEGLYCYNSKFSGLYLRQRDEKKDATKFNLRTAVFYEYYK